MFYVADIGGKVCILHGFQKKSNQTPKSAIDVGARRYRQAVEESQQRRQEPGSHGRQVRAR
ncbi:type II toxin-antitoxin system RelE/ParE family toxin [Nocardia puris]|uniref:type II toxin-antitoxin system RelE/ParE family toxin n=1 Tax=Nocardia puris TaxID=208602 RepID=UPI001E46146B